MAVSSIIRPIALSAVRPALGEGVGPWTPAQLFQSGDARAWYDPSDLSTLFKDTAGTQPVTADGDSVALIRDKSGAGNHLLQATGTNQAKYKTSGGLHWLVFDGTDDSYATAGNVDFTGTDEVLVGAGVYKASDAAQAAILALGSNPAVTEWGLVLGPTSSAGTYGARYSGSLTPSVASASGFAAPHTGVVTSEGDVSTDLSRLRVNAGSWASSTGDIGTGNFKNAPIFVGARGGGTLPFNGRLYGLVIRNRLPSSDERTQLEAYIAGKSGVTL